VPNTFLSLRFTQILTRFRWSWRKVITPVNRLNDYILGAIGTATTVQDTTEYLRQHESVLPRCQTGTDAWRMNSQISLHRLKRQIQSRTQFHVDLKMSQISYRYVKNVAEIFIIPRTVIQYHSAANVATFICSFVHGTSFACHGNTGAQNRCRTNAALETSYDCTRSCGDHN